ncbi:Gfo/Idh/MocA family oxidoreductase [Mammaliicoccus fleurettii]|uniref:Gfo/Idh/MocA family oxidoreductase n=1 Tax=Mammaliicoccus fleurettii TaxID=150056 RepID=A0ABS5MPY5_9STAP|nr:Gfo/Idh/MocA family oxidoreductase [Mammaliicoccus fleurettii]MBL0847599.1 Gfo/Idh/MocA family oxidoreductase [Mammaliicoccus fleurettii]MBS3673098.1 Gfo/Idh/MocA family oxidoreductase [Mammaliicoccus fleurettii]MBS3697297.1 Gfo/Idh/MocA family oxidoreductase [Mammaliicoccus fleurettii]
MKFGFIGTNWISDKFIENGSQVEGFEPYAVFSRTDERANYYKEKHQLIETFTNLEQFCESPNFEAVYIASPNAFHFEQAALAIKNKKHVIIEKPATIIQAQFETLSKLASEYNVTVMEAMKSTLLSPFVEFTNAKIDIGEIRYADFHYHQYSSRYDKYKNGIVENAFKSELGNGALMDLGVYTVAPIIHLFGMPENIRANGFKLDTGADGQGNAILDFNTFQATISYSKICDRVSPSEIIGENGYVMIDKISAPSNIKVFNRDGELLNEFTGDETYTMKEEIIEFMKCVKENKIESTINTHERTLNTIKVLDEIRKQIGVEFNV